MDRKKYLLATVQAYGVPPKGRFSRNDIDTIKFILYHGIAFFESLQNGSDMRHFQRDVINNFEKADAWYKGLLVKEELKNVPVIKKKPRGRSAKASSK